LPTTTRRPHASSVQTNSTSEDVSASQTISWDAIGEAGQLAAIIHLFLGCQRCLPSQPDATRAPYKGKPNGSAGPSDHRQRLGRAADLCETIASMPVTIVLADGFDGENVELVAAGRTYLIRAARTSLLTGMAHEVVVDAGDGPVEVRVRLGPAAGHDETGTDEPGSPPGLAWSHYDVPQRAFLVLDYGDDGLTGRVLPGPLGFA
jgi:hypothetical protein